MNRIKREFLMTTGVKHVLAPLTILPQGTGAPLLGEGDPNGAYYVVARTGVGVYTITTKDPFVALVKFDTALMLNAPASTTVITWGAPTQSGNGTWVLTFTIFTSGVAADIAANANNRISVDLEWRNTTVVP